MNCTRVQADRQLRLTRPGSSTNQETRVISPSPAGQQLTEGGGPEIRTATVLFADIVESTAQRVEIGAASADRLRRVHDGLLRSSIEAAGGEIIKGIGDGVHAYFPSASSSLEGAIGILRTLARYAGSADVLAPLSVRIGIASGDVAWDDSFGRRDCFGIPVVEAARLQQMAQPGQVLLSDLVRRLAGERSDLRYRSHGALELKGLPHAVEAFSLDASDHGERSASANPVEGVA